MVAHNYSYRFEIKPGKFVYVQLKDAKIRASRALKRIRRQGYRPHEIFFHFKRSGGHVAAMHAHEHNRYFSRFDISNFFGRVTRSKIDRALRDLGLSRGEAFDIAADAVVVADGTKALPFGFKQSPMLATLVLERSLLGIVLKQIADGGLTVTVYVDDIIVSGTDAASVASASARIEEASKTANFPLSEAKAAVAEPIVEVFNCSLTHAEIAILEDRMEEFVADYNRAGDQGRAAIENYVGAVSPVERIRLLALVD